MASTIGNIRRRRLGEANITPMVSDMPPMPMHGLSLNVGLLTFLGRIERTRRLGE